MEHDRGGWCTPSLGGEEAPENNLTEKKEETETVNTKLWTFKEIISFKMLFQYAAHIFSFALKLHLLFIRVG